VSNLNRFIGMGRLTAAPELRTTDTGIEVSTFTIAIDRKTAKGKEKATDFITCTAWRQTAAFICRYFDKGGMIAIEGSLQSRKYQDRDGNNRTAWEIQVDRCHFCGGGKNKSNIDVQPPDDEEDRRGYDYAENQGEDELPF